MVIRGIGASTVDLEIVFVVVVDMVTGGWWLMAMAATGPGDEK